MHNYLKALLNCHWEGTNTKDKDVNWKKNTERKGCLTKWFCSWVYLVCNYKTVHVNITRQWIAGMFVFILFPNVALKWGWKHINTMLQNYTLHGHHTMWIYFKCPACRKWNKINLKAKRGNLQFTNASVTETLKIELWEFLIGCLSHMTSVVT